MAQTTNYNAATAGDPTKATIAGGGAAAGIQIVGAFTGSFTPESSVDGTTYNPHEVFPLSGGASVVAITAPGTWRARLGGAELFRLRATALTVGTPVVSIKYDSLSF